MFVWPPSFQVLAWPLVEQEASEVLGHLSLGFQVQDRPLAGQVASARVLGPDMEEVL